MTFDLAQMIADREAGTPGPWRSSQTWRPPIGHGPHNDMVNGNVFSGYSVSGSNESGGHIYPTLAAVHNFPENIHANARRIARVPLLEAEIIRLTARVERLEGALNGMLQSVCGPTGFAEAVRHNSGHAYPWHSLDDAEAKARAELMLAGVAK